jgi:hypothetical protein
MVGEVIRSLPEEYFRTSSDASGRAVEAYDNGAGDGRFCPLVSAFQPANQFSARISPTCTDGQ